MINLSSILITARMVPLMQAFAVDVYVTVVAAFEPLQPPYLRQLERAFSSQACGSSCR
jgi:hypothetical protein